MSSDSMTSAFSVAQLPVISGERAAAARESARVAGYAAGWAEGMRAAAAAAEVSAQRDRERVAREVAQLRAEVMAAVDTLGRAAQATIDRVLPVLEEAGDLLAHRSVELARAVVGVELLDHEQSATSAVTRALALPNDVEPVAIRLHPQDLATLRAGLEIDGNRINVPEHVRLIADANLTPGDAVSEYDGGFLDSRIDSAFARANAALTTQMGTQGRDA